MKKIFFIPCIIVCLLGTVSAQNASTSAKATEAKAQTEAGKPTKKTVEERAKLGIASVDKIVTLKGDQSDKLNKAFIDFYTQKDALRTKIGSMPKADYLKALEVLVAKKNADIKSSLAPDQVKLLDAHLAAMEKAKSSSKTPTEEK